MGVNMHSKKTDSTPPNICLNVGIIILIVLLIYMIASSVSQKSNLYYEIQGNTLVLSYCSNMDNIEKFVNGDNGLECKIRGEDDLGIHYVDLDLYYGSLPDGMLLQHYSTKINDNYSFTLKIINGELCVIQN